VRLRSDCRWGASDAYAVTVHQVVKFVGDCTHHCAGSRGVGEGKGGAFGAGLAVSADGRTAMIGAPEANAGDGAVWVFVRNGHSWRQQGAKLVVDCTHDWGGPRGRGENQKTFQFGQTIALSANGWNQQGTKLIGDCTSSCTGPGGTGELSGRGQFGAAVALSRTAGAALIGAPSVNCRGRCDGSLADPGQGAAWSFAFSGL
jgi:hypothetical protein